MLRLLIYFSFQTVLKWTGECRITSPLALIRMVCSKSPVPQEG